MPMASSELASSLVCFCQYQYPPPMATIATRATDHITTRSRFSRSVSTT
jgi:hypothetical protein